MNRHSEMVTFYLNCAEAKAYLVGQKHDQKPLIVEMQRSGPGFWFARVELNKGVYRFRYYCGDGRNVTYLGPAHVAGSGEDGLDALVSIGAPASTIAPKTMKTAMYSEQPEVTFAVI